MADCRERAADSHPIAARLRIPAGIVPFHVHRFRPPVVIAVHAVIVSELVRARLNVIVSIWASPRHVRLNRDDERALAPAVGPIAMRLDPAP